MIECKVGTNQVKIHIAASISLLKDHIYISTDVFLYGSILFYFSSLILTMNIQCFIFNIANESHERPEASIGYYN